VTHVYGKGPVEILFVGEAPGATEDAMGIPFVGQTGKLLTKDIELFIKERPATIAFGNVVRCRPPKNRTPELAETAQCIQYLEQDIEELKPQKIVCLGGHAMSSVIRTPEFLEEAEKVKYKITKLRGKVYEDAAYKYHVLFHPSYISRNPGLEGQFIVDLSKAFGMPDIGRLAFGYKCELVDTLPKVHDFVNFVLNDLPADAIVAFDVEAAGLNRYNNTLVCISFSFDDKVGYVVPMDFPPAMHFSKTELGKVEGQLYRLFSTKGSFMAWLAQHAQFDLAIIRSLLGIDRLPNYLFDLELLTHFYDENLGSYSLESIGGYLGLQWEKDTSIPIFLSEKRFDEIPQDKLWFYSAGDSCVTRKSWDLVYDLIKRDNRQDKAMKLCKHLISPMLHMLEKTERNGSAIDIELLNYLSSSRSPVLTKMSDLEQQLYEMPSVQEANDIVVDTHTGGMPALFGKPFKFDIKGREYIKALFFDVLEYEPVDISEKTQEPSVGKAFFGRYADFEKDDQGNDKTPRNEAAILSQWRKLEKLRNSYLASYPNFINVELEDGMIHCKYHLSSTVTGRASAREPGLQQVTKGKTPEAKFVKDLFIARYRDSALCLLDVRQSEVRWLAQVANDKVLAQEFWKIHEMRMDYFDNPTPEKAIILRTEGDIHRRTAALMFDIAIGKIADTQRSAAKNIVFGCVYGMHVTTLASDLGISVREAQALMDTFFSWFEMSKEWLDRIPKEAQRVGYVDSEFGRRRHLAAMFEKNVGMGERRAKNSPIQSASSDYVFYAGCKICDEIYRRGKQDEWLNTNFVHDSIMTDLPVPDLMEYVMMCEEIATREAPKMLKEDFGIDLIVPIEVEFEIGKRWGSLVKWGVGDRDLDGIVEMINSGKLT